MWQQVERRARPRAGPRRRSTTRCVGTSSSSTSRVEWWPPLAATDVFGWLRDRELLARIAEGVLLGRRAELRLVESWPATSSRSRTCRWSTSCATSWATSRPAPEAEQLAPRRGDLVRRRPAGADHRVPSASTRRRGRAGRADRPDRGRRLRPRPGRRGAGPHADAVADGRPPRPAATLDHRRRSCAVAHGRTRPRPRPRGVAALEGKDAARLPPLDQLPQLGGDLRATPRRTPRGSGSDADLPTRSAAPGSSRTSPEVDGLARAATVREWPRSRRRGRRHRRRRRPGRLAETGRRLARRPRSRSGSRCSGARHQGPGVRRHRGGASPRRSSPSRPPESDAVRRPHPRHPASRDVVGTSDDGGPDVARSPTSRVCYAPTSFHDVGL